MNGKRIAALAAALLILLAALLGGATAESPTTENVPTSYSSSPAGTLALHDWFSRLGFPVSRMTGSFEPAPGGILFLIDPTTAVTASDSARITSELSRHLTVVIALGSPPGSGLSKLLSEEGVHARGSASGTFDAALSGPLDLDQPAETVELENPEVLDCTGASRAVLVEGSRSYGCVTARPRAGRLYVFGSANPFTNRGLLEKDDAKFVFSLTERAAQGSLTFDEYHHGFASSSALPWWESPLGAGSLVLAFGVFVFGMLAGKRLGVPVPFEDPIHTPSSAHFIRSIVAFQRGRRNHTELVGRLLVECTGRLASTYGIPADLPATEFELRLRTRNPVVADQYGEFFRVAMARTRSKVSDDELVKLARMYFSVDAEAALRGGQSWERKKEQV